jgi:hypothetical protein
MPRSRSSNEISISLFPFLAVLMSAMGALIFLLIIVTSKVRHDTIVAVHQKAHPNLPVLSIPLHKADVPNAFVPPMPVVSKQPAKPLPIPKQRPVQVLPDETPGIDAGELQAEINKLETEQNKWLAYLHELDSRLMQLQQQQQADVTSVQTLKQGLTQLDTTRENMLTEQAQLKAALDEKEKLIVQAQEQINQILLKKEEAEIRAQAARKQNASRTAEYMIVPFEGQSGTTRRPIYLECNSQGIFFRPEDAKLNLKDMEQFTPRVNPLLYGVATLREYWTQVDKKENPNDPREPYLLILVRPSGIMAFYATHTLLGSLSMPYGYELIEEDRPMAYPPPSAEAKRVLLAALKEAYQHPSGKPGDSFRVDDGFSDLPDLEQDPRWSSRPDPRNGKGPRTNMPGSGGSGNGQFNGSGNAGSPRNGSPGAEFSGSSNPAGSMGSSNKNPFATSPPGLLQPGMEGSSSLTPEASGISGPTGSPDESTSSDLPKPLVTPKGGSSQMPESQVSEYGASTGPNGEKLIVKPKGAPAIEYNPSASKNGTSTQQSSGPPRQSNSSSGSPGGTSLMQQPNGEAGAEQSASSPSLENQVPIVRPRAHSKTWGPGPSKLIGLEQTMLVKIGVNQVQIGKNSITVGQGETAQQLNRSVMDMVETEIDGWGNPPQGFRWIPTIKCQIAPGGNQHYERMVGYLRKQGINVVAEQVFK